MFPIQASQWVINKKFDLLFFIGSALLGIVYFFTLLFIPQYALLITAIVWVLFAQTHFGSTWFIYLDKKNREYFRQHPWIYYGFPLAIFAAVLTLGFFNQVLLVVLISIVSLYHVTKQSTGVLQLYRVRNKEFAPEVRKTENAALFSWSLFFAGFGGLQLPDFQRVFGSLLPLARGFFWLLLLVSIALTVAIIIQYRKRDINSFPKTLFLLNALLMYSPYVYAAVILVDIYQMEIATLTSLITHYMQYMGLVWLINRNKYGADTEYARENPILRGISKHVWLIIASILVYALLMAYLRWGIPATVHNTYLIRTLPNVVLALTAIHFYLDAFIWRFRNPFYKETVTPFVRPVATPPVDI